MSPQEERSLMRQFNHKELPGISVMAEQVGQDTYAPLAHKLGAHVVKEVNKETGESFVGLNVLTHAGWVRASEGCWIVDSAAGIFVLTPAHFKAKYEEGDEEEDYDTMIARTLFVERGGKINGS